MANLHKPSPEVPCPEGTSWMLIGLSLGMQHQVLEPPKENMPTTELLNWQPPMALRTRVRHIGHQWTYRASTLVRDRIALRELRAKSIVQHVRAAAQYHPTLIRG